MTTTSSDTDASYDIIIVGGGLAGLHVALEMLKLRPAPRIALFEKYEGVGGRAYTFHGKAAGKPVQWEAGAGRICSSHEHVLSLFKRYGLHWVPIGSGLQYKESYKTPLEPNYFEPAIPVMIEGLAGLPAEELATHTIRQLLTKIHGAAMTEKYLIRFPYRSEVDVMRADRALALFAKEMHGHEGYGICAEGLGALAKAMRKDVEKRGCKIFTHHELVDVAAGDSSSHGKAGGHQAEFRVGPMSEGPARPSLFVSAKHVVLAMPSSALAKLPVLKAWKPLRHLRMEPLLRVYGVFPKGEDGKLWTEEYGGRIVTATPVRYIIGGDPKQGSVQISYTDSQDAEYWMQRLDAHGEAAVGEEIVAELRRLLKPTIPSPILVKAHAWKDGVTYWLPGKYDPAAVSREALTPLPEKVPGLHICGESFSLRQGWMEGALEHAEELVKVLKRKL